VLTKEEIARGSQGALRLLQRDPSAPFYFENSMEACLRSFWVMALVAPIYLLYVAISYSGVEVAADTWEIALAESLAYVVDWLLFPVLFYEIARRRRWVDRYPRYIGALNWINLPVTVVMLIDASVALITPMPFPDIFNIAVQALVCYWIVITSRQVLGVGWGMAVLLLIVNVVPTLFLSLIVIRFLGVMPAAVGG
jgi:hypothetical protein